MYDFVKTWNPLAGECSHKCKYCYRNKMMRFPVLQQKYTGKPRLDHKDMKKNLGTGNYWFVCSMTDLFADDVPDNIIISILSKISNNNNKFLFQSKNPKRFYSYRTMFPVHTTLCTTIETNRSVYYKYSGGQEFFERIESLIDLSIYPIMLTIEPIMDFDVGEFLEWLDIPDNVVQINIGANSSKSLFLPEPPAWKLKKLIAELEKFTIVHQKPNLKRLLK